MTTINKQLNELMVWAPRVEMSDVVLRMLKRGALFYNDVKRSAHAANRVLDIIEVRRYERLSTEVRHLFDARTQIDIMRSLNGVRAVLGIE